ncbi:MAG: putative lipid II flippase FtsW [Kiritimatiellae bacterium]|nr:putative lipid II flippase FtsW [Kiritimatiellia bacterium]
MRKVLATLTIAVFLLLGIGIVLLASAGTVRAQDLYGVPYYFFQSQLKWLGISMVVLFVASVFDYRLWKRIPWLTVAFFCFAVLLLVLVLIPGVSQSVKKGSARWLSIAGHRLGQPSELAKIAMVVVFAVWLDRIGAAVKGFFKGFLVPCVMLGIFAGLLLLEPDFGATAVVGVLGLSMMFVAGVRIRYLLAAAVVGVCGVGVLLMNNSNRMSRIMAFMDPDSNSDAGHQLAQSILSFKNGGALGVGYTRSIQKFRYLPEAHTDFIFAIGGEEFGIIFSIGVLILFVTFAVCGFLIAVRAQDRLGKMLAFGMTFLLAFQAAFNIGVVTGCLPTKGIALPFISYGPTNLLVAMAAVGILMNVGRRVVQEDRDGDLLAKNIPVEL